MHTLIFVQVLSSVWRTHHMTLVNLTSSTLSFTLSCSSPLFTITPSPPSPDGHTLTPHTALGVRYVYNTMCGTSLCTQPCAFTLYKPYTLFNTILLLNVCVCKRLRNVVCLTRKDVYCNHIHDAGCYSVSTVT